MIIGAPEVKWPKLITILVSFSAFACIQVFMQNRLGWSFDFILAFLITSIFFLEFIELLFLVLFAAAAISWQPGFSMDIFLMMFIPIILYGARYIFSWQTWMANLIYNALGIMIFYLLMGYKFVFDNWLLLLNDLIGSVLFASVLFFVLEYVYQNDLA